MKNEKFYPPVDLNCIVLCCFYLNFYINIVIAVIIDRSVIKGGEARRNSQKQPKIVICHVQKLAVILTQNK